MATALDFDTFRWQARTLDDIQEWVLQHVACNTDGVQQIADDAFSPVELWTQDRYGSDVLREVLPWLNASVTVSVPEDTEYTGTVPSIPGVELTNFTKPALDRHQLKCTTQLSTADWPFLAARLLYKVRHIQAYEQNRAAILSHVFPRLNGTQFDGMVAAGLIPNDEDEFSAWLYSFRAQPEPVATPVLPEAEWA